MSQATAREVLMLALINRARLDPAGEAVRYGIDLNEGLNPGTISATSKQPLAFSDALNTSADGHSQAMIDSDFFAHVNPNTGSDPQSRGTAAGYAGGVGENIAWRGSTGAIDATQLIFTQEQDLFVDQGVPQRGHRTNMLYASYQEIGVGQILGVFTYNGVDYNASMITQDFGIPNASKQFVTGIAYNDTDGNAFYSVGEARSGVTVASSVSGSTTTNPGGDFALNVGTGPQTITFSGGGLPQNVSVSLSMTANTNALVDLVGTSTIETSVSLTAIAGVSKIIGLGNLGLTLTGTGGNDYFVSAPGNDTFNGGAGSDTVQFSGNRAAYTLTDLGGGSVRVAGPSGTDTLNSIETLAFADQSVNWSTKIFQQPTLPLQSFGYTAGAGAWTSQDAYPRYVADVSGDGKADIVGFGSGGVVVSLATGSGTFAAPTTTLAAFNPGNGWTSDNSFHRELADVNGDHMADIVGFGNGGVYVSLATGGGNFAPFAIKLAAFNPGNGWTSQNSFPRQLADVNGDGKADIVAFGNGGVYVALAHTNGDGGFDAPTIVRNAFNPANGWTSQDQFPRLLGDVNGDGKADIVAFGNGGVYVSLATGGGNFAAPFIDIAALHPANGWTSQTSFPRLLADVNNDHMADIVGFGNGGVYVALATGGGHFAAPVIDLAGFNPSNGWTSDNQFHRAAADVTGDGAAEIVGFGNYGTLVALNDYHVI